MNLKVIQMLILVLLLYLETAYGKIIFAQKKDYAVGLVKHFLQKDIFPDIRNVKVINFGYETGNTDQFDILMKSLHEKHAGVTVTLSDFDKTTLDQSDHVLLLLLTLNHIEKVFQFIDRIGFEKLELINAVMLFSHDFTKAGVAKLYEKPQANNFYQIIYAFPSFERSATGVSAQVHSGKLVFYLENLILSKLSSSLKLVKFNTNMWKIYRTLKMLQRQQKQYMEEINKYPMKTLLYLRPLSVEKNPPNSKIPFAGIDMKIFYLMAKSLGSPYTLEIGRPEEYGTYHPNNTPTSALTKLINGSVVLAFNRYPVVVSGKGIATVPYDHEEFCFVMLMPENQLRKWSIFMPFKMSVWISLLLVHTTIFVIYMFIREKHWKVTWLIQSAVSATHFPATRNSHRLFWFNWLLLHIIINACYTSFFVTQLVPRKKQHPYKTLHDLITRNITFLSEAGHFQEIQDSFPDNKITPYYGEATDINRTSALLTSYLTRMKLTKLYGSRFYKVDECLLKTTVGPLMSTRNPNLQSAVRIMQQILATGILKHWVEIYLNHVFLYGNKTKIDNDLYEKEDYAPLKIKELENVFIYFAIGLALSTMIFFCEMIQFTTITKPKSPVRPKIIRVFPYTD